MCISKYESTKHHLGESSKFPDVMSTSSICAVLSKPESALDTGFNLVMDRNICSRVSGILARMAGMKLVGLGSSSCD